MIDTRLTHAAPTHKPMKVIGADIHGTYGTARRIAELYGGVGWLIVIIGGIVALAGLGAGGIGLLGVGIGLALAAVGLLLVAAQQMLRAQVDAADYARQSFLLQIALAEGRSEIDLRQA